MSETKTPRLVYGTGTWGSNKSENAQINTREQAQAMLDVLRKHGVTDIDTSRNYPRGAQGTSEVLIGQTDAPTWATFDTKVFSQEGDHNEKRIAESISGSIGALKVPKLHIEYLHWPDRSTPLEETLRGINEGYKQGKFEKFGVSNYAVSEVREMLEICEEKGYIKPSVYQGQYNALARRGEKQLFPFLRENNIAFYAYTPAAAGVFSATSTRKNNQGSIGALTRAWYGHENTEQAIQEVVEAAQKHQIGGHELALRWVLHHSLLQAGKGDGIILGSSRPAQLDETLTACKRGPLPPELATMVEGIWPIIEDVAPTYSPWVDLEGNAVEVKI